MKKKAYKQFTRVLLFIFALCIIWGLCKTETRAARIYKITFDANSGKCSKSYKKVTYNRTYGSLPTPTKKGYIFQGWYTDKKGGKKITSRTKVLIARNQRLYARWKNWYSDVLKSKDGSYRVKYQNRSNIKMITVYRKHFDYYNVTDINKDGIKELILATSGNDLKIGNRVLILTYYQKKVVPLICFESDGFGSIINGKSLKIDYIKIKSKTIYLLDRGSKMSDAYRIDYKINKDKLKKICEYKKDVDYSPYYDTKANVNFIKIAY